MEAGISVHRAPQFIVGVPVALLIGLVGLGVVLALLGASSQCATTPNLSSDVPPELVPIYEDAAATYRLGPRGPSILAGINKVETDFGKNLSTSSAGAEGWMQFMPSTWASYGVDANDDGTKRADDPWDAIFAAAHYLRASGAPRDWRGALLAYNHSSAYVQTVFGYAQRFATADVSPGGIGCASAATGPVDLTSAIKLSEPRRYVMLPARFMAAGHRPEAVDARILADAEWVLAVYGLRVTAARESGHASHGEGTALDMVPVAGNSHQAWLLSAERLAEDLGWSRNCGSSGLSDEFGGSCKLVPAIRFIGYDGFPGHGEGDHIHVSWQDSLSPGATGELVAPESWVKVFPVPGPGA